MPTIQDLKLASLATLGYTGTIDDAEFDYLGSLGYTGTLPDRRRGLWAASGFTNEKEYLLDKGYTGTLGDMQWAAFTDGAYYAPPTYLREDFWLAITTSPGYIELPMGNAGIVRDSDPIIIEVITGSPSVASSTIVSGGAWNTVNAFRQQIEQLDPEFTLNSNGTSCRLASSSKNGSILSLATDVWNFSQITIDTVLKKVLYKHYALGDEGNAREGNYGFGAVFLDQFVVPNTFIVGRNPTPLFGAMTGSYRSVKLYQGETLIGYWPIDEGSGTTAFVRDGTTAINGTITPGANSWVTTDPYP